jgi:hypothetical protein
MHCEKITDRAAAFMLKYTIAQEPKEKSGYFSAVQRGNTHLNKPFFCKIVDMEICWFGTLCGVALGCACGSTGGAKLLRTTQKIDFRENCGFFVLTRTEKISIISGV